MGAGKPRDGTGNVMQVEFAGLTLLEGARLVR